MEGRRQNEKSVTFFWNVNWEKMEIRNHRMLKNRKSRKKGRTVWKAEPVDWAISWAVFWMSTFCCQSMPSTKRRTSSMYCCELLAMFSSCSSFEFCKFGVRVDFTTTALNSNNKVEDDDDFQKEWYRKHWISIIFLSKKSYWKIIYVTRIIILWGYFHETNFVFLCVLYHRLHFTFKNFIFFKNLTMKCCPSSDWNMREPRSM